MSNMARNAKVAAGGLAAALAVAVPLIAQFEGKRNVGYLDPAPAKYETICYGHMEKGVFGQRRSDAECTALLNADAEKHAIDIGRCLPADLPTPTRAAFISIGFNLGSAKFCASSMARWANLHQLGNACASISKYVYAGNRILPGLVRRRAAERALCEKGITP